MTRLKAIRFRNLDEAREVIREALGKAKEIFSDAGQEPQGLLAIIPEDRLAEKEFYRLFGSSKGMLVEVEKIEYSGYGPPAEEEDYMGFASEESAYVMAGCRLPIETPDCPDGARDIHHLESLVLEGKHPLDREDLAKRLDLSSDWDFETLMDLIVSGEYTAPELDAMIHRGVP